MTQRTKILSRRSFLLAAGAGSAAAVAAVVARKPASAPAGKGKTPTRGYHATEHVNNYYRTAKV